MAASINNISLLNDDDSSVSGVSIRRDIPALEPIKVDLPVVTTRHPAALAYLALQVVKAGKNKSLIVRAITSAVMHIFGDETNMTGSTSLPVQLTGLEVLEDDTTTGETVVVSNLPGAVPVSVAEIEQFADMDGDEIASFFGILFLAGIKKRTNDNRIAFNEKRAPAVQALVIGELGIFVPGSTMITDAVLDSVYASFNSMNHARSHLVKRTATKMGRLTLGAQTAFSGMFMLLENQGIGGLKIIKEATQKYNWVRTDFPELRSEFLNAQKGQDAIMRAPREDRPFLKAIYGNAFVPVAQGEITNLLGVTKNIMARTHISYQRFNGGSITPDQEMRIQNRLDAESAALLGRTEDTNEPINLTAD